MVVTNRLARAQVRDVLETHDAFHDGGGQPNPSQTKGEAEEGEELRPRALT